MAFLSNPSPIVALSCQSLHCVSHSSLWICWFCWIRATSPKVTQPLILLSIIKSCLILGDDWVGGSQFLLLCDLYPPKKKHIHRQKFSTKKRRNRAQLFLTFILQFIFLIENCFLCTSLHQNPNTSLYGSYIALLLALFFGKFLWMDNSKTERWCILQKTEVVFALRSHLPWPFAQASLNC